MAGTRFRRGTPPGAGLKNKTVRILAEEGRGYILLEISGGHRQVFQNKKTFYIYQKYLGDIVKSFRIRKRFIYVFQNLYKKSHLYKGDIVIRKKRMRKRAFIFIRISIQSANLTKKNLRFQNLYKKRKLNEKNLRFQNLSHLTHAAASRLS